MKKFKVRIILILGILLGRFFRQIKYEYHQLHQPLIQAGAVNIEGLIKSIGQVVNPNAKSLGNASYQRFDAVYQILQDSYYDTSKLQTGIMLENAVKAFVDAIDDPYTVYMDSNQNSGFQEELKGQADFEGVGAVVTKKEYYVMIEEVLKGSPAFNAGLMALDRIIMIDSGSVKDLDLNDAVAKIRGPKGTSVLLTIERVKKDGSKEVFEKSVIRDKLSIPSVTSEVMTGADGKKIGYINISIIGEETENILKTTVKTLKKENIQGVILDLRGNGGGLLPISAEIASHFLPKGTLVVKTKYKTFEDEEYLSKGYQDLAGLPLVILVDGGTASAGEIIALALQEGVGAKLVGTQTFGKGSVQTMDDFADGASLKYTIGKRYSPSGRNIDKEGIAPDVVVEFDPEAYTANKIDNQLEKAKEILSTNN